MANTMFNFFRGTNIFKVVIAVISALSLIFNLFVSFVEPVGNIETFDNVIVLIGDGMGENHLEIAKQEQGIDLFMETLPIRGRQETRSFSDKVTDSAASGTALSCGVRTNNGCLGVYPSDTFAFRSYPQSVTEYAISAGKMTGIVTTDSNTGATPAAYSAHTYSRGNTAHIAMQQINSGIDLILGSDCGKLNEEICNSRGYEYVTTKTELDSLQAGQKIFGQFYGDDLWKAENDSDTPTLTEMTIKALELLDNENGFFLMVEGAHIDKHSHANALSQTVECVYEFDRAIRAAVEFAQEDGNTLVMITADHETGAITFDGEKYVFTSGSHSSADVPFIIYGSDNIINNGDVIKNIDFARYTAIAMGCPANNFPYEIPVVEDSGLYLKAS